MGFLDSLGPGEYLVIGLSVLIAAWFLVGNWINNQRCDAAMRWMKKGLAAFGEPGRAQLSMPDSKGIRFKIEAPSQAPLKNIQGSLALQRKENLPLWGYQLLRGKQDSLRFQAEIRPAPPADLRAFHASNLSEVEAARIGKAASLDFLCEEAGLQFYTRGEAAPALVEKTVQFAKAYPNLFLEVTFQRKSPQLIFQARLTPLLRNAPEEFFRAIERVTKS